MIPRLAQAPRARLVGAGFPEADHCPWKRPEHLEDFSMNQRRWSALALLCFACSPSAAPAPETAQSAAAATVAAAPTEAPARLAAVLAAQSGETKSRYASRHPKEMVDFVGIAPGMTVVDTLPGPVWWTGILLDYLGPQGKVIDADYSAEMWTKFGSYSPDPAAKQNWPADTVAKLGTQRGPEAAQVAAFQY